MVLVVIFSFGRQVHDRLDWQGQVRELKEGFGGKIKEEIKRNKLQ